MTIQYIKDEEGKDQYVVIPYSDYFRMRLALLGVRRRGMKATGKIFLMNQISNDDVMLPGRSMRRDA